MGRLVKIILIFFLSLVILLGITVIGFFIVINPNDYKETIKHQIHRVTGRELAINGDIKWKLFPSPGFEINDITLSNSAKFNSSEFLTLDQAEFNIKLLPLIRHRVIETGKLSLHGITLNLIRNANGDVNWANLHTSKKKHHTSKKKHNTSNKIAANTTNQKTNPKAQTRQLIENAQQLPKKATHLATIQKISIKSIEVTDATINLKDDMNNRNTSITFTDFKTHHFNLHGKPFSIAFDMQVENSQPIISGSIKYNGMFELDTAKENYQMYDANFTLKLDAMDIDASTHNHQPLGLILQSDANIDFSKQSLSINNFNLLLNGLRVYGNLKGENILHKPIFKGKLDIPDSNLTTLLASFGYKSPFTDPKALKNFSISCHFDSLENMLKLTNVHGKIDNSQFNGNYTMTHNLNQFNLNINKLDLNRYRLRKQFAPHVKIVKTSPKNKPSAQTTTVQQSKPQQAPSTVNQHQLTDTNLKATTAQQSKPQQVPSIVNQHQLTGTVKVANLLVKNFKLKKVLAKLSINNNILTINPLNANIYQGNYHGKLIINRQGKTPSYTINGKLNKAQIKLLLNDLFSVGKISGIGNLNGNITARGTTQQQLIQTLNGRLNFVINNGAIEGFDIMKGLNIALSLFGGKKKVKGHGATSFATLKGTLLFKNGIAQSNNMLLTTPLFDAKGKGQINLVNNTIDYHVHVNTKKGALPQLKPLEKLMGRSIDLKIVGPLKNPKIKPDPAAIDKAHSKIKLRDQIDISDWQKLLQ